MDVRSICNWNLNIHKKKNNNNNNNKQNKIQNKKKKKKKTERNTKRAAPMFMGKHGRKGGELCVGGLVLQRQVWVVMFRVHNWLSEDTVVAPAVG